MSESAEWRQTADEIFASFGDVVKASSIVTVTAGDYDADTGAMSKNEDTVTTVAVPTGMSKAFWAVRSSYDSDLSPFMVRGSDFDEEPSVGSTFIYDTGGVNRSYLIQRVESDDAGTGSYFVVYGSRI